MCTQEVRLQLPLGTRGMTWKSGPIWRAREQGQAGPTRHSIQPTKYPCTPLCMLAGSGRGVGKAELFDCPYDTGDTGDTPWKAWGC